MTDERTLYADGTWGVGRGGAVCPAEFRELFAAQRQSADIAEAWINGPFADAWRKAKKPATWLRTTSAMRALAVKVAERLGARQTGTATLGGNIPCELWETPDGGRMFLPVAGHSFEAVCANWTF